MKKLAYLLILPAIMFFSGCEKTTTDAVSRITYYANITITGEEAISILVGDTYVDAGASATENGVSIPVTTVNNVDPNEPGIYTVEYSATNVDGYTSTVSRYVAVLPEPEIPGSDLSGEYFYVSAPSATHNIIKLGEGFYFSENTYSSALTISAYFISTDGLTLTIPEFQSAFGPYYGSGTFDPGTGALTYVVNIPDFGIFNRNRFWQKV